MPRITVTISESLDDWLESQTGDSEGFDSKSEVMRHYVERGREADDLERELELAESRLDDLRRQMVERENVQEKVDVLATQVEEQRETMNAPFFVRWYRWVRGARGEY